MTIVLTVMSGMDPHTIRVTGLVWLECWESVNLVLRSDYHSGLYGMFDVTSRGEELLALVIVAWHRMQPLLSACQPTVSLSFLEAPMSSFPLLTE
jgi:hypothetical protein